MFGIRSIILKKSQSTTSKDKFKVFKEKMEKLKLLFPTTMEITYQLTHLTKL